MNTFTYGSLFSGIGGIDLGLDRAGMQCKWQCEIDDYATKVLTKHWPDVARFRDIRTVGKHNLTPVDLICGGFPCQDISNAGKRAGIDGERSGLWTEFYRIICELRPQFIIVENVATLYERGLDRVLADLARCGYDAEWQVLPAAAFGAPHARERLFIVVHPYLKRGSIFSHTRGLYPQYIPSAWKSFRATDKRVWLTSYCQPGRDDDGISSQMDRFRVLGNAVVPQIAEYIGNCIMNYHQQNLSLVESVG